MIDLRKLQDEYWKYPDEVQRKMKRIVNNEIDEGLLLSVLSVYANFKQTELYLSKTKVSVLHKMIDRMKVDSYFRNFELQSKAMVLRRRTRIRSVDAYNLLVLAEFTRAYNKVLVESNRLYQSVYDDKLRAFGTDRDGDAFNIYNELLPTGVTIANTVYNEASFRARRLSQVLASLEEYKNLEEEYLVLQELRRARDSLLKESTRGGYHGILDLLMAFYIGKAILNYGQPFIFHAVIDNHTTDVCESLDGKLIKPRQQKLGVNIPPIIDPPHPCRSWVEYIT